MEDNKCDNSYSTKNKVTELLKSPYVKYGTSEIFSNASMHFEKPTREENKKYHIEYLKDGTAIYYKRKPGYIKNFFCCY
ncbi:conserved Plasmodium protein, unknown function [Plasmodium gallinaceum]|uniref:Uncharacterized protein n=1 Tax=Plasmodium gallinaceum TaxID=5849 RepID=A0A1J1GX84_PLAGA|nr:conserved Plasmodium protein, unknown function [Plasmodium gallinaceum]CRG97060.1 conserved Plasmodium protein, unknown function [Plasmodium gallinaceum]